MKRGMREILSTGNMFSGLKSLVNVFFKASKGVIAQSYGKEMGAIPFAFRKSLTWYVFLHQEPIGINIIVSILIQFS